MASSVEEKPFPLEDIQNYVRDQLQDLRADMIKSNEAVSEYRAIENANKLLVQQVDAQKTRCSQLEEQISGHRQTTTDMKSRHDQLEQDLAALRQSTLDHNSMRSDLQQKLDNTKLRVNKAEEAVQAKFIELAHVNSCLHDREEELDRIKVIPITPLQDFTNSDSNRCPKTKFELRRTCRFRKIIVLRQVLHHGVNTMLTRSTDFGS